MLLTAPGLGVLLSAGLPIRPGLGKRLRLTLSVRLALLRVKTLRRCGLRRLPGLLVRVVFGHGCAFPNMNVSHAWIYLINGNENLGRCGRNPPI